MLFDMTGRVALVTGAGRGIGRAIALRLAEAGAACGLAARTKAELDEAAQTIAAAGGECVAVVTDVSDRGQAERCVETVLHSLGPVDILVNNAGVQFLGPVEAMPDDEWERVIRTNLTSVLYLSRPVIPGMKERRWGRIVNIASVSGQTGGLNAGVNYSASKGGMIAMTKKMARELGPYGITVNAVAPGMIETVMGRQLPPGQFERVVNMTPLGRFGVPDDIAYAVLYLASEQANFVTGETLSVNGGIHMD